MAITLNGSGSADFATPLPKTEGGSGLTAYKAVIQYVTTQDGEQNSGTGVIPIDDTIPQITEGNEFITVTITPESASNKLIIEGRCQISCSASNTVVSALFQDSTADALAAVYDRVTAVADGNVSMYIRHEMTAGTTSATTFKIRVGLAAAGTTYFNGYTSRVLGGVCNSFLTVTEIEA